MDRRCSACEGVTSTYERHSLLLVPFVDRYRCRDCGTKMDLFTKVGERAMALLSVAMPVVIALLPARRFKGESDRGGILAILFVQGIVVLALVVHGHRRRKTNPLIDG